MNTFSSTASIVLKVLSVLLVVAAAVALYLSNRFSLQLKQKFWSGDKIGATENDRARTRILVLRIGAGICIAVTAVLWIVVVTLQAYQAT